MAELSTAPGETAEDLAAEALAEVQPGGHFFAAAHTLARYDTAFYAPLLADLSNFGSWTDAGAQPSDARATAIWQACLAAHRAPAHAGDAAARLAPWLAARRAAGGRVPGE